MLRSFPARWWTSQHALRKTHQHDEHGDSQGEGEGGTDRGGFPPQQTLQVVFRKQCHMVLPRQSTMPRRAIASDCHKLPTRPTTDERTTAAASGHRRQGRGQGDAAERQPVPPDECRGGRRRTQDSAERRHQHRLAHDQAEDLGPPEAQAAEDADLSDALSDPHRHAVGGPQDARDHGDRDHELEELVERGELPDQVAPEGVLGLGLRLRRVVLELPIDRRREGLGLGVAPGLDEHHGDLALLVECILARTCCGRG